MAPWSTRLRTVASLGKFTVWLWDCFGPGGEQWSAQGDGTLKSFGSCLDTAKLDNGTPVGVGACSTAASQQWSLRPDGTVLNVASGRCLDDSNGALTNGNKMQIYDCNGSLPQLWSTPISAS